MYLLQTVTEENAQGAQKDIFEWFADKPINAPLPLQRYAISPEIAKSHLNLIAYFSSHPTLSFPLLASIRYAVAAKSCYESCIALNSSILKRVGMTEDELEAIATTQQNTLLEKQEEQLLQFVVKRVFSPESGSSKQALENLQNLGWTEQDIFDATYHGYTVLTGAQITASLSSTKN